MTQMVSQELTVNGNNVYYELYSNPASSHTLVMLHGFLSSSFSYRKLIPLLVKEYSILTVDLPPFGKSGKDISYKYSYENLAKTVLQLTTNLSISHFSVVGHSMGGQISLNMMKLEPERVNKGVLLCSSGYLKRANRRLVYSSFIPYFHLYVKLWLARSGVRKNLQNVVHNQALIDDEMLFGYLQPFLEDDIFRALTRMIRDREGDLSPEMLKTISTPCLLIWGEHDRVVPLRTGKQLHKDIPNSKLVVLKEAGHLVPEEKPEEVASHLREFLLAQ
ncbi:alpha/beta fold hydrolase [Peribacillus alkalitolerans]|uniref:alpha/beta fold hydrolase n=1 Tax=Peribacillus alkalitolerans TaxID=1550385 RepID=UPI0013D42D96|nr:alpha/beta hydrolase [Peribacillus alkalitolerans]